MKTIYTRVGKPGCTRANFNMYFNLKCLKVKEIYFRINALKYDRNVLRIFKQTTTMLNERVVKQTRQIKEKFFVRTFNTK